MFDTNACAIELLKMKNSEDFRKEVAAAASSSTAASPPEIPAEPPEECPNVKQFESNSESLLPELNQTAITTTAEVTDSSSSSEIVLDSKNANNSEPSPPPSTENSSSTIATVASECSINDDSHNNNSHSQPMDVDSVDDLVKPSSATAEVIDSENGNSKLQNVSGNNEVSRDSNSNCDDNKNEVNATGKQQPSATASNDEAVKSHSSTPSSNLPVQDEQVPSTSASANVYSDSSNNLNLKDGNSISIATRDIISSDNNSSSEEEDDIHPDQFTRDSNNMGSDNNDPAEELIIKRNTEYLLQRCSSLMQRVQGMMHTTAKKHVARQLHAVSEHAGFNSASLRLQNLNRNSSSTFPDNAAQGLTKQSLAEIQFTVSLMKSILRESMGCHLEADEDSATDESDTDDDEVVLPDENLVETEPNPEYTPYLPVENNPFIEAIKLEKLYETKRTTLDFSINECEYSLTKSAYLRKHCKARKPLFQLEKPSASSSNVINIPVDSTSSVKFYHDSKPTTIRKVSDMMSERRSSLEQDRIKIGGKSGGQSVNSSSEQSCVGSGKSNLVNSGNPTPSPSSNSSDSIQSGSGSTSDENSTFIPTIKSLGSGGISVLGVEFVNSSDPNESASRCSAIKRPDKNRKVFQLGGIQNIFRDTASLPSVRCTCFGRSELCAVCLGRAKKKAEISHVFMNHKDKLAILDETFHKSLSLSEDVPLEVLLVTNSVGNINPPLIQPSSSIQQLIKDRSMHFPPDFLETGPKPKKPRVYGIKPYVEAPAVSPKKDGSRYDESSQAPRKRAQPRKSQTSFEEKDLSDLTGKGLGWPSRERKDSMRRTRNQEFDIDNIVIPYSMAASTRVEQLVYKPIETPRWRVLEYAEIFTLTPEEMNGKLEDMTNAAFIERHNKCEVEEKKRFTQSLQKALNATRKTRRLDSTGRSESISEPGGLSLLNDDSSPITSVATPPPVPSPGKSKDKEKEGGSTEEVSRASTPVPEAATVITEAMANQALKSLFKVGRRRTVSTSTPAPPTPIVKEIKEEDEEEIPQVDSKSVDPWPKRAFPLPDAEYKEMLKVMEDSYTDVPDYVRSHDSMDCYDDPAPSPKCIYT